MADRSTLPGGWSGAKLRDLIELKYGKSLPAKRRNGNEFAVYGSNGEVGKHSKPLVERECLIVGRKGSIGEVHRSKQPCSPIDTTYYVDDFYEQSISFWEKMLIHLPLKEMNRATALPGLNREEAYSLDVQVPPLNEQRRIADKIDALQAKSRRAREALETAKPLLEKFRQSVLAAAFRGDLTAEWRKQNPDVEPASKLLERIRAERRTRWEEAELAKMRAKGKEPKNDKWKAKYKEPEPVDTSELPELPEGWRWSNIGELFEVGVGATPSRKEPDYWNGDVPWVSSGEVAFCRITETKEQITELGLANSSTEIHPIGTVLVGMIGEGKTRGQTAILDVEACNNQNSAAIRVSETEIPPEFVYRFFKYQYVKTRSIGSGNNQPALNKGRVQAIAIPVPPIEEIQHISFLLEERFIQVDRFEELSEPLVDQIDRLDQSILAKAFRGELVPQDPNDEPASVLLERIKAEREAAKSKDKKPTRKRRKK